MPIQVPKSNRSVFDMLRKKLECKRYGIGSYVNGLWVDGDVATFFIYAVLDGLDNETLQTLPEGYRSKEVYKMFTDAELRVAVSNESKPDVVIIKDKRYQVIRVTDRNMLNGDHVINHFEIIIVRENIDDN